jgi:hypothetical protein
MFSQDKAEEGVHYTSSAKYHSFACLESGHISTPFTFPHYGNGEEKGEKELVGSRRKQAIASYDAPSWLLLLIQGSCFLVSSLRRRKGKYFQTISILSSYWRP